MYKFIVAIVLALAPLLGLSQETVQSVPRGVLQLVCNDVLAKQEVPPVQAAAVCNCTVRYLSMVHTEGESEYADYVIPIDHPIISRALNMCYEASKDRPELFRKKFGVYSAEN